MNEAGEKVDEREGGDQCDDTEDPGGRRGQLERREGPFGRNVARTGSAERDC